MLLALANLDTGMFFCGNGWNSDYRMAQVFSNHKEVSKRALEQKVENAAEVMMFGSPQRPVAYIWLTEPKLTS